MSPVSSNEFKCPWPKGGHEEEHFPCGIKYIDEKVHHCVPGHFLTWWIKLKAAFTTPQGESIKVRKLRNGEEAKKLLEDAVARCHETKWRDCIPLIKSCLECEKANWDMFARIVNKRLEEED